MDYTLLIEVITLLTVNLVLGVTNLIGNFAVNLAWLLSSECKSTLGLLLVHLALCDIGAIFRIVQNCIEIINHVYYGQENTLLTQPIFCDIVVNASLFYFTAEVFTQCGIAIHKYLIVTQASLFNQYVERKLHIWTIVLIWIASLGIRIVWPISVGISISGKRSIQTADNNNFTYALCEITPISEDEDTSKRTNRWLYRSLPIMVLLVVSSLCYGAIFRYFIATHLEVKRLAQPGTELPSLWSKVRNLRLHMLTLIALYASVLLSIIAKRVGLYFSPMMQSVAFMANSSFNPFFTLLFVHDFNIAARAFVKCQSPKTYRSKLALSVIQQGFANQPVQPNPTMKNTTEL